MKRAEPPSPISENLRPKRVKAGLACTYCRKSKARCEDQDANLRCRRCRNRGIVCSRELETQAEHEQTTPQASVGESPTASIAASEIRPDNASDSSDFLAYLNRDKTLPQPEPEPHPLWPKSTSPVGIEGAPSWLRWRWAGAPMLILYGWQNKTPEDTSSAIPVTDNVLRDVLTEGQIHFLTTVFGSHYLPWMNLMPNPTRLTNVDFLDLVICTVTAHNLQHSIFLNVSPRLEALTEKALLKHMFNPSLEAIHALTILAFWTPVGSTSPKDGRFVSASGINIGRILLEDAAASAQKLRKAQGDSTELAEAECNARLWISMLNVEAISCLGTGRKPLGVPQEADKQFIQICDFDDSAVGLSGSTPPILSAYDIHQFSRESSLAEARDVRLGITAKLLETLKEGLNICLTSEDGLSNFLLQLNIVLDKLDTLEKIILPLCYLSSHEVIHFKVLQIYCYAYKVLTAHHAISQVRQIFRKPSNVTPWLTLVHSDRSFIFSWGRGASKASESLLMRVLDLPASCLATAPDVVFSMIAAACMFFVLTKSVIWARSGQHLCGYGDSLLALVRDRLAEVTVDYDSDHVAAKCALLVLSLLAGWKHQRESATGVDKSGSANLRSTLSSSPNEEHRDEGIEQYFNDSEQWFSDVDPAFWQIFMSNINASESTRV